MTVMDQEEAHQIFLKSRGWTGMVLGIEAGRITRWLDPEDAGKMDPHLYSTDTAAMIQKSRDRVDSLAATEA